MRLYNRAPAENTLSVVPIDQLLNVLLLLLRLRYLLLVLVLLG